MLSTKKYFLSFMLSGLLSVYAAFGQKPVDVIESVVKVGIKSEEVIYYGFAAGDQLIFSFEEANGKELKELEIMEMPGTSKFMDYKTSRIENKTINVPKTAIYKFRFTNSAFFVRVCKYKIQRIPASPATQNFNTTVYFDAYNDTVYVTEQEGYVERIDTIITNLQDRVIKVNQSSATTSSKSTFNFILPDNTEYWGYYISADNGGQQVYAEAAQTLASGSPSGISKLPHYSPVAAVALDAPSYLTKLQSGQTINYWIVENENAGLFTSGAQFKYIKKGKVVNDFFRMEPRDGTFYFCFHNDNPNGPVTVTVKIAAIQINEIRGTRWVKVMHLVQKMGMHLKN